MSDPRDRFRTLDRQDAPDLWSEATARSQAAPARTSWLPRFGGGLAVAAVVVVGVIVGLQLATSPTPIPGGPDPSPSVDSGVVTASAEDGDYRLTITSLRGTWATDEAIRVWATLEYLGTEDEATLWGAGSGLIGFGLEEVTGDRVMGPAGSADCVSYAISELDPIESDFLKSGGYSPDDPDADFWEAYFAETDLYLPAGEWMVGASALFDAGDTCTAVPTHLAVSIALTIEGGDEPTSEPEASPSEVPSVTPAPTPVEPPFTCNLPITLDMTGTDFHPLITQDIRVGTHAGFDRIVFEYDGGTPFVEIDVAQPPFVRDPSGLPLEVNGSPVYRVTLTGATNFDMESGEQPYRGSTNFEPGYPQIVQFVEFGDFEATHNWYLGTNGGECLRAFTLNGPDRLVIDVQH